MNKSKNNAITTVSTERFPNLQIELYSKLNEMGTPIFIVSHAELVDAIYSQDVQAVGCHFSYGKIQILGDMHYLVECVMSDGNGTNEIREFGEVMASTLKSEIASDYPGIMCINRAFDRAAIRYLGLEKRTYSDNEIRPSSLKDNPVKEEEPAEQKEEAAPAQEADNAKETAEEKETQKAPEPVGFSNVNTDKKAAKKATAKKETSDKENASAKETKAEENGSNEDKKERCRRKYNEIGNSKLGFLNGFADKKICDIFEQDKAKLIWIAENYHSGANLQKAEEVRFYLKCRGIPFKTKTA